MRVFRVVVAAACLMAVVFSIEYKLPFFISCAVDDLKGKELCPRTLPDEQFRLCRWNDVIMAKFVDGARIGLRECEYQFRNRRWNCTAAKADHFEKVMAKGSREAAFTYAVASAAITWSISRECALSDLPECGCGRVRGEKEGETWEWGGCGDNLEYGIDYTTRFISNRERVPDKARALMNDHNIAAGTQIALNTVKKNCRCHGLCGGCSFETCWKELPGKFHNVGEKVKSKFNGASIMKFNKTTVSLQVDDRGQVPPTVTDLIFLETTDPTQFCSKNVGIGSHGTSGRLCDPDSSGIDRCDHLCCGRGYTTREEVDRFDCNCRFVWCCSIKCDKCEKRVKRSYCKE
eukprot:m.2356 g.2356  ORF g.2356 m.2356 type:complete len:347 (+) comp8600_c0_seq1:136-1176(+)